MKTPPPTLTKNWPNWSFLFVLLGICFAGFRSTLEQITLKPSRITARKPVLSINHPVRVFSGNGKSNTGFSFPVNQGRPSLSTPQVSIYTVKAVSLPERVDNLQPEVFSLIPISEQELPTLEMGMINVTDNQGGYLMKKERQGEVHGIGIKYDPSKLPIGNHLGDIHTYWYDLENHSWRQLIRDSIDTQKNIIFSQIIKDGNYINAIINAPELPQTQGYIPTTMNDMKVGNPASNVQLINYPSANNQGSADLSYQIELPSGRQKIQPNFTIVYNSNGGSGWMGEGWSLAGMSSITVDTRWGVPRYNSTLESETYLLNGQMLAYKDKERGKTPNRVTTIRRSAVIVKDQNVRDPAFRDKTLFVARKQQNFELIERFGSSPESYFWVVTHKNGTKYYYGKDPSRPGIIPDAMIKKATGTFKGIAEWKLVKAIDVFGNYLEYKYEKDSESAYTYPKSVSYTLHPLDKTLSYYQVIFDYTPNNLPDRILLNARYGTIINPKSRLLRGISVQRKDRLDNVEPIRKYVFDYKTGAFGKTLLAKITQLGDDGSEFNHHQFTYHNEDESQPFYALKTAQVNAQGLKRSIPNPINLTNNGSTAIGGAKSSSNNLSMYVGIGVGDPSSVNNSGGIQYTNISNSSSGINTLVDIDGDGLPDKMFVKGNEVQYEKNISNGSRIAFHSKTITLEGVSQFLEESSRTTGWGARINFTASGSFNQSRTEAVTKTYLSDVNGDGLLDLVKDGRVLFNTGRIENGKHLFSLRSSGTPNPINGSGTISPSFQYSNPIAQELIKNNPLHEVVRIWEAPYNGEVAIHAPVKLLRVNESTTDADGVFISIEHKNGKKEVQLKPDNFTEQPLDWSGVVVAKGDRIYFRVQSGREETANGANDKVQWDPKIVYVNGENIGPDAQIPSAAISRYQYSQLSDYLLSNPHPLSVLDSITQVTVSGKFKKGVTMDSVKIDIVQLIKDPSRPVLDARGSPIKDDKGVGVFEYSFDKALFTKSFGPDETSNFLSLPASLSINLTDRKIQFLVSSKVNINIHQVQWEPVLTYSKPIKTTTFTSANEPIAGANLMVTDTIFPVPTYVFNDSLSFPAKFQIVPRDTVIQVYPTLTLANNQIDSSYWFAIKSTQKVLAKKLLTYKNGRLTDDSPLSVRLTRNDPFLVTFESQTTPLGKLKDSNYRRMIRQVQKTEYFFQGNMIEAFFSKKSTDNPHVPGFFVTAPQAGTYKIVPKLSVGNNRIKGKIAVQIWINNTQFKPVGQDTLIQVNGNRFDYPLNFISLSLKENDLVSVQFIFDNDTLASNPTLRKQFSLHQAFPAEFWMNRTNTLYGPMYQGWGQFVYNGMNNRSQQLIDTQILNLSDAGSVSEGQLDAFRSSVSNSIQRESPINRDPNFDRLAIANAVFIPMHPFADLKRRCWIGGEDSIYIQSNHFSTSRLGIDQVKPINPFAVASGSAGPDNSIGKGIVKLSTSTSKTYSGGAFFLEGTRTNGTTEQVSDFLDVNGDRFPDVVNGTSIQVTNPVGTLDAFLPNGKGMHSGENSSSGLTVSGTVGGSKIQAGGIPNYGKQTSMAPANAESGIAVNQTAGSSIGASGAFNQGEDKVATTWIDMNGDGLPDKVNGNGYDLNLGYNEYSKLSLTVNELHKTQNVSLSPGITAGFSVDKNSFSGGAGLAFSASKSLVSLQDMNSDGLPDRVSLSETGDIEVEINTGSTFITSPKFRVNLAKGGSSFGSLANVASFPVRFMPIGKQIANTWFNLERSKFNASNSVSLGGSATFGFSLLFIKIVFNPAFNHAESIGRTIRQIVDINGDGYADILYSTAENNLEAFVSTIGQTNKLAKVVNPLGGTFSLQYAHTDASTHNPGGRWVMSELIVNDHIKSDRSDLTAQYDRREQFTYRVGKYDRFEREFLGFGTVITTDVDFKGRPYRDVIRTYDTQSYYMAGNLIQELTRDSQDTTRQYTIISHHYEQVAFRSALHSVGPFKREIGSIYTPLTHTLIGTYEGSPTVLWQSKRSYIYNIQFGYVTEINYKENPESKLDTDFDSKTTIKYEPIDLQNYIIGLPTDELTVSRTNKILRHRGAEYYPWSGKKPGSTGPNVENRRRIWKNFNYLDGGRKTTMEYQYADAYGNLSKVIFPNSVTLSYEYDSDPKESNTHSYIVSTTNETYSFESRTMYHYGYGIPIRTKDINDNLINYQLDQFGRITKVIGPKECQTPSTSDRKKLECDNSKYTIIINYSLNGSLPKGPIPVAKVTHFDEKNPEGIQTLHFIDGFNRTLQTKKTADLSTSSGLPNTRAQWVVSGRVVYDALGRATANYFPDIDSTSGLTFLDRFGSAFAVRDEFDLLDRRKKHILADGSLSDSTNFSKDTKHTIASTTYLNDPESGGAQVKKIMTNGSGLIAKEISVTNKKEEIITQYLYDPIQQLIEVTDAGNHKTAYRYDPSGNRKEINHPDAGRTTFLYNDKGQLSIKITANSDSILYRYRNDRLVQIEYPKHPENNVLYVYSNNKIGNNNSRDKLIYQEDASGAQAFEYGELGEITKTTRTLLMPFSGKLYTFTTAFTYDSWNRIKSIKYPDLEEVSYRYNRAGHLAKILGERFANLPNGKKNVEYVSSIGYDEFDQQVFFKYGNKTQTFKNFQKDRRRLATVEVKGIATTSPFFTSFTSAYGYDNRDNIKTNSIQKSKVGPPTLMTHLYRYDNLNRLDSASGMWKNGVEQASYRLGMSYDSLFNITRKTLKLTTQKPGVANPPRVDYSTHYIYDKGSSHYLRQLKEEIQRNNVSANTEINREIYEYDKNGNNIIKSTADKSGNIKIRERRINWDEENRINAISLNGYVSHYIYDASGQRTIKLSTENDGVFINGKLGEDASTRATFSIYANPYFSLRNGNGLYTKHIYVGNQRVISQIENERSFGDQRLIPSQTSIAVICPDEPCPLSISFVKRRALLNKRINGDFDSFDLHYERIKENSFDNPPAYQYTHSINPFNPTIVGKEPLPTSNVPSSYFYHSNQIGSTAFVTDDKGAVGQYIEYLPFGETFMEQRQNYSSQFLFNGKEQDEETGLYYYGARYYDPHTYQWLGVDPMAAKFARISPYTYTFNNPIIHTDPDGREPTTIAQREQAYWNFYLSAILKGDETRWPQAAANVSNAMHSVANPNIWGWGESNSLFHKMLDIVNLSSPDARWLANKGNRMIYEDAVPKLNAALAGHGLVRTDALKWDAMMLFEEQFLVQPLWDKTPSFGLLSEGAKQRGPFNVFKWGALINGVRINPFPKNGDLKDVLQRWDYGMGQMYQRSFLRKGLIPDWALPAEEKKDIKLQNVLD